MPVPSTCDAGTLCPDEDHDGFAKCGCQWSGTPCDCDDTDPSTYPGAPETCDAPKDTNCSGVVADRCPEQKGCFASTCVPQCRPLDDFGCAGGSSFWRAPGSAICLCAPENCTIFGCPAGLTCNDDKTCVPNCNPNVRCPHGQVCRGFGCVDPCAEVTCPEDAVCTDGRCLPSCACGASCPAGETCDQTADVATCVEPACVGVRCPAASHCERGTCVDDCEGVVCPPNRVCRKVSLNGGPSRGKCVDLCSPDPCKTGFACQWRNGSCTPLPIADGGLVAPTDFIDPLEVGGAGWMCNARGAGSGSVLAGLLVVVVLRIRRLRARARS